MGLEVLGLLVGEVPRESGDYGGEDQRVGTAGRNAVSEEVEIFALDLLLTH